MKVINVNGISQDDCKCGSWIEHWENYSGKSALNCSALKCFKTATIGSHVKSNEYDDGKIFIVPFCVRHNVSTEEIELADEIALVSANVKETCG